MELRWLTVEHVISFHDIAVRLDGSAGFPHPGYLEAAVLAPQHTLHYDNSGVDLFDLAAVYLYHIAQAHAFTDGNKRTGYLSALVFLGVNGLDLMLPENVLELAKATVAVAEGTADKVTVAAIMRAMPRQVDEG